MERKRITCPETAHLELIDYERTPLGIVIDGCSRSLPRCSMDCTRVCAARMDRRDRLERSRAGSELVEPVEQVDPVEPIAATDGDNTAPVQVPSML